MANLFNEPITLLKKAVDLKDLEDPNCGEVEFELDNANLCLDENNIISAENEDFDKNQVADNICFISDDEGDDDEIEYLTEMEQLLRKMKKLKNSDITLAKDGGVLKQLRKPGIGKTVPQGAVVFVHYNAYTEVGQPPYDSTRLRGDPVKLRLGQGNCIEGLEIAILSMAKSELSRFLIQPDYAYGEMGCPPRIPPKAKLIMDVEVLNFTEQDGVDDYYDLSPHELQWKEKRLDLLLVGTSEHSKRKMWNFYPAGENILKTSMRRSSSESSVLKGSTQFEDYTIYVVELPDIDVAEQFQEHDERRL
ncbi:Inactive peptidyl-prolyl cis-trans isomerase fkbp6 [Bulinus truncatus]|nr:Inactive peptidyl-prolyl cis-trans isomerase fkbp6 [Bulinus truncatus]